MKKLDFFCIKPIGSYKKLIGISLLCFSFFVTQKIKAQTNYYYNGSGAFTNVASWGTNTNGTGSNPADFVTNSQVFIIQNGTNITHSSGNFTVTGTGSKIVMGNPTYATPSTASSAITLIIAAGSQITSSGNVNFEVSLPSSGNHKIIYQNTSAISFSTAINDPNLELVFDNTTITTTTNRTFGNVSLINNANIDMSGASITVNNLTIDAGSVLAGPIGSSSQFIAIKTTGAVVINGTFRTGRTGTVSSGLGGGFYTTSVPLPVTVNTNNASLLFENAATTPALTLGSSSTIDYYRGTSGQTGTQGIAPMAYANLILSNSTTASNKSFAIAGNITVSRTLTINLSSTATITQPSSTTNVILLPGARLVINSATAFPTNGRLTLQSDASGTATIGTVVSGGSINGNVTVQQFIPAGSRRYRFLSHPFTTAQSISQLTDNIDITGNTAGTTGANGQVVGVGLTATSTNNPSAYYFNTATADGNATNDGGWIAITDTTTANSNWGVGKGIRVLMRGTKNQANTLNGTNASPAAVTLDMAGTVNIGSVAVPLVTGGSNTTAGYNMVGNPYPSPVDIGAVLTAAGSTIGNTFFIRNPQTGSYTTVNPIPANYILPAYSAFFVKANSNTSLNFTEANKNVCTTCPSVFSKNSLKNNIQFKVLNNGEEVDNLSLNIDDSYANDFDAKDGIKLLNDNLNIYFLSSDKQKVAANYCNAKSNIPLGISLPKNYGKQTYSIHISGYNVDANTTLQLHDKLTNTYTSIRENATYNLAIDPKNAKSIGDNRLELIVTKNVNTIHNLVN